MHTQLEISKATGLTIVELETAQRVILRVMGTYRIAAGAAARELTGMTAIDDRRSASWAVRLRVFDAVDSLIADSDEGADHEAEGETVVRGVAGAYEWACELISGFQPAVDTAALTMQFDRRSPTLRVAVSRGAGKGHITAPYAINGEAFFARLDFVRQTGLA